MLLYLCFLLLPALAQAACKNVPLFARFFISLDGNRDGYVSRQESDNGIQVYDANRDGTITLDEARENVDPEFTDEEIVEIFDSLDFNGDGIISAGLEDSTFQAMDTNGDNLLISDEYTDFITKQCQANKSTTTVDYYN